MHGHWLLRPSVGHDLLADVWGVVELIQRVDVLFQHDNPQIPWCPAKAERLIRRRPVEKRDHFANSQCTLIFRPIVYDFARVAGTLTTTKSP
jgi:hypothetical protein